MAAGIESPPIRFMIIHCHSPRTVSLPQQPNRRIHWGAGRIHGPRVSQVQWWTFLEFLQRVVLLGNNHFPGDLEPQQNSSHTPLSIRTLQGSGSQAGVHKTQVPSGHRILAFVFKAITLASSTQEVITISEVNQQVTKIQRILTPTTHP